MQPSDQLISLLFEGRYKHSLRFTVLGDVQGKGRPRFTRAGTAYTPTKTRAYEKQVRAAALEELCRQKLPCNPIGSAPVLIAMVARYAVPPSCSRKERAARLSGEKAPGKPDTDNISKVKDALNGVLWDDDKQVVRDLVIKEYTTGDPELVIFVAW